MSNQEMNDSDIADQLRLAYRCLRFMRNTKWWWCEFLFVWEMSLVNAYLAIKKYYRAMGFTPKWKHWDFQEKIVWALLDVNGPPRRENKTPEKQRKRAGVRGARKPPLSEKSMGPAGRHSVRLDGSKTHFPVAVPADKKRTTGCHLHRLASKMINGTTNNTKGMQDNVWECLDCDARLCLKCWDAFHSTAEFGTEDYCKVLGKGN